MDINLENNLLRACGILFGPEAGENREFLFYIQLEGVKAAFRRKALMTHPDRQILTGIDQQSSGDFIEVTEAYKQLSGFINSREEINLSSSWRYYANTGKPNMRPYREVNQKKYYSGVIPKRPLLFAEYLYYSGNITWESLIRAIAWQRQFRPRFGEIACGWRYLCCEQLGSIIKCKRFGEKIGDASLRMNLLHRFQVQTILRHQMRTQRRIGEYFIDSGIFTEARLYELLSGFRNHNDSSKVSKAGTASSVFR